MGAKRKKKPRAAQHLIDSLLDEKTPSPSKSETSGVVYLREVSEAEEPTSPQAVVEAESSSGSKSVSLINAEAHELQADLELERTGLHRNGEVQELPQLSVVISSDSAVFKSEPEENSDPDPVFGPAEDDQAESTQEPDEDKTIRLDAGTQKRGLSVVSSSDATTIESGHKDPSGDESAFGGSPFEGGLTELKTSMKQSHEFGIASPRLGGPLGGAAVGYSSTEAALRQSESLRIAQARITELEAEIERLRRDNEKLATAGETLSRRTEELIAKIESLEGQKKEAERIHEEEKKVLRGQVQQKEREIGELRGQIEEMEARLENNFKKIRVRERELEHRLEIVRLESQTLISAKDKMILELKRQIDQLTHENEYGKQKTQELYNQYKEKQETVRRVVRALRIALTMLEGEEDSGSKKSE